MTNPIFCSDWCPRQNINLESIQQIDGFDRVETGVQNLISGLVAGQNDVRALSGLIREQTSTLNGLIHRHFMSQTDENSVADYQHRFLESLHFPEIKARQQSVAEAYVSTFEWIFQGDFTEWLESDSNLYWVSGKAGSGKSTLMNYICEDQRTTKALQIWSKGEKVITPTFFFWQPGSEMQKSTVGLLRSLLYQLLEEYPNAILSLNTRSGIGEFAPTSNRPINNRFRPVFAWTEKRLQALILDILRQKLVPCRVCFFIDGLDEFNGNYDIVGSLIQMIVAGTTAKVCVSSRPYRIFRDTFSHARNLKLEDLTENDIRYYATNRLSTQVEATKWVPYDPTYLRDIVDEVVKKAGGVFLWVRLAIDDQIEGILNQDDVVQLREKLALLPSEMEELYMHMIEKIDKAYRKETVQLFNLILEARTSNGSGMTEVTQPSLLKLAMAKYKELDDLIQLSPSIRGVLIRDHCDVIAHRIVTICGGLLEIQRPSPTSSSKSSCPLASKKA